jgi:Zn-dependent oligopeptidase
MRCLFLLQEFRKIRDFKREKCGSKCGDLEPWDEAYYTSLMKSSTYNLDSSVSLALLFVLHFIYNQQGSLMLLLW